MIVAYESEKLRPNLKMLFLTNPYTSLNIQLLLTRVGHPFTRRISDT